MDVIIATRTWRITEDILKHIHTLNAGFKVITLNNIEPYDFELIIQHLNLVVKEEIVQLPPITDLRSYMRIFKAIDYLNIPFLIDSYSKHLCNYIQNTDISRLLKHKEYLF